MKTLKIYITVFALMLAAGVRAQLTLSADQCREMALRHSEDIRIAANAYTQADLDHAIAKTNRLPRLSGTAGAYYMAPDMDMSGMTFKMHGAWSAGIMLTQPIYVGGKINSGIKLSSIGRDAAALQIQLTTADVIANADNAYWTYIATISKLDMLRSLKTYVDSAYSQVEASVAAEMSVEADLLRVKAKLSDIRYQIEKVECGIDLCRMNLCDIIGVDASTQIIPADTAVVCNAPYAYITTNPDSLTVKQRPEYGLLTQSIRAEQEKIRLTRADYLPSLALSAGYTFYGNMSLSQKVSDGMGGYVDYSTKLNDNFGIVMLSLNIPLVNWGEGAKKVRRQRLEVANSVLTLEKNSSAMQLQLASARNNLLTAWSLISTAQLGVDEAAAALTVMQDRFDVGMCTLTDLLESQSQWQQAMSNLIEARTQYRINVTDYLHAAGQLTPE